MSISNEISRIERAKQKIKDVIIAHGVDVSDFDTISSYADKIKSINGSGSGNRITIVECNCNLSVYKANDGNSIREMEFVEDV